MIILLRECVGGLTFVQFMLASDLMVNITTQGWASFLGTIVLTQEQKEQKKTEKMFEKVETSPAQGVPPGEQLFFY